MAEFKTDDVFWDMLKKSNAKATLATNIMVAPKKEYIASQVIENAIFLQEEADELSEQAWQYFYKINDLPEDNDLVFCAKRNLRKIIAEV